VWFSERRITVKRICSGLFCHLLVMASIGLMTPSAQAQTYHFSFQIGVAADTFNDSIQVFVPWPERTFLCGQRD